MKRSTPSTFRRAHEAAALHAARKAKRACPVCGEPVGAGWSTFCGAECMFRGRPKGRKS